MASRFALVRAALLAAVVLLPAPAHAQVPEPADVFGFRPGTDYELADHDQMIAYFDALDAASDRVVIERIGTTTLGRPMILALISSEANLRDRERYREAARRLALAKDVDTAEARRLAKDGKAVVWIDGGLHSTEVAHAQHTPELAHWLATDESDEARRIRDNVILLLMPVMNPDGLDIVVDWYRGNLGTEFETAPLPVLYQHYIGHDNNRDWYMFTQLETQAVARQLYHEWLPQIVYNHHQSGPFPGRIWIPPFEDPVNPNLDPLVVSSINQIGEAMRKRFDEEGKSGVSSGITYDLWWNGSMRGGPDFHNMLGFLTETALYRYATPHCYAAEDIPETFGARNDNLPAHTPSNNYNNPWLGGCWHLRDPVEYMLTASKAVLDLASKQPEDYLFNIYRMGRRQTERGERAEGGPFAYIIDPAASHDPGAAVELLRVFRIANIEIRRADRPFTAGGKDYGAGVYVIPPQAFRPFVVDLIEPKTYPERRLYPGGPPKPPYDMTGYELSLQMGVSVDRVTEPFTMPRPPVDDVPTLDGGVRGSNGDAWLLAPVQNASVKAANHLLAEGTEVSRATASFEAAGVRWPAGTHLIRGAGRDALDALGRELGVELAAVEAPPSVATRPLRAPRIGLYKSHVASMDEGWIRWLFDQYGFGYESLSDAEVRAGDLDDYDIIILPSQDPEDILDGHAPDLMPPEYVGGIGADGAAALKQYVEAGGWLLAIEDAADFAIEQLGLPVHNVVDDVESSDFFIPGSLIRVDVDSDDALAHGMSPDAIAMFARSHVFEVTTSSATASVPAVADAADSGQDDVPDADQDDAVPQVYARYAAASPLASGWALGAERYLAGRAAALRVPVGRGLAVLIGFAPHKRGQPHNTFKLLFNALYAAAEDQS